MVFRVPLPVNSLITDEAQVQLGHWPALQRGAIL